jgi:hypothetical protein
MCVDDAKSKGVLSLKSLMAELAPFYTSSGIIEALPASAAK